MKTGLTLGKFAPFHAGHQQVIETARREMDRVIVLVYDAPSTTAVPLSVRSGWIRDIYPDVEVIEGHGGPEETGYTDAIMTAQEQYIGAILNGRKITAFYSSEPYGEQVSRFLGCINRLVDLPRTVQPISASIIRANPLAYLGALHPVVCADIVPRIVFLGGPSTGKSSAAQALAEELREPLCPEYGRDYWFAHQKDHRLSMEDLETIATEQVRLEREASQNARFWVVSDTSPLTTLVYAQYYYGHASRALQRIVAEYHAYGRLLVLCDTDIPFDDTPDRSGPASREEIQALTLSELASRGLKYHLVSGSVAERIETVTSILTSWRYPW